MSLLERIELDTGVVERAGFNPYDLTLESGLMDRVRVGGAPRVDLASNNYLNLAGDPRVVAAACRCVEEFGVSLCGTPVATGATSRHRELQARLASFVGVEATLLFASCYQLGSGFLRGLARPEDCVLIDRDAHSSLVDGARVSGCKLRPFRHNDLASLERNLRHAAGHPCRFVLTESVFSTEGSTAPLPEIVELCRRYDAVPVIDDSHGIGVLGSSGQGALRHFGLDDYPGLYLASLGKALAGSGGVLGGSAQAMKRLRYTTPSLIYSTGVVPSSVGAVLAVLDILESDGAALLERLRANHHRLRSALLGRGFNVAEAGAPINAVVMGDEARTIGFAKELFERGILATPFIPPSVLPGRGTVRLIAGAHLDEAALEQVVAAIGELRP